jgi:transcriptional regulator with XRE-family HTH domain
MLQRLIDGLRECDPAIDREFKDYVSEATRPNTLGLSQREISARLGVTPMTLQRWCKGESLPFPGPRRFYLGELVEMLEVRVERLKLGDHRPEGPSRRRERLRPADVE